MATHPDSPGPTAVAGGKGGCGKTTTVLGLALALVRRGRRPIVVDADVDVPDLHIRAGVDREPGLAALATGTHSERVLQSSPEFGGVDVVAAGTASTAPDVAIRRLDALDRPVLLDCPAGAGPDAAAPLRAADRSVLVTLDSAESRQDAAKTARMARALGAPPVLAVVRAQSGNPDNDWAGHPNLEGIPSERDDGAVHRRAPAAQVSVADAGPAPLSNGSLRERFALCVDRLYGADHGTQPSRPPRTRSPGNGRNL